MSYANRKKMSSNRTVSIVIVALLHVGLGYALVTGLAYNVIKQAAEDLKTFDVEDEPPPPPEEPPPPPDQPDLPPPPTTPPPLVRTNLPPPPIQAPPTPPVLAPPPPVIRAPPPPPPPPPVKQVAPKSVSGNLQGLIRSDDYPPSALDSEEQGTVSVVLQVGTSGRVTGCTVSGSSGSSTLDRSTCRILTSRAKFTPARDSSGNPTTGTHSQRITWRIE